MEPKRTGSEHVYAAGDHREPSLNSSEFKLVDGSDNYHHVKLLIGKNDTVLNHDAIHEPNSTNGIDHSTSSSSIGTDDQFSRHQDEAPSFKPSLLSSSIDSHADHPTKTSRLLTKQYELAPLSIPPSVSSSTNIQITTQNGSTNQHQAAAISPDNTTPGMKRKKSVTFHPEVVTSSRLLSPMANQSSIMDEDRKSPADGASTLFKHPAWLVQIFQRSWKLKTQDWDEKEENAKVLSVEKLCSRAIDVESPIWYFIPKKLIVKSSSSDDMATLSVEEFKVNYSIDENELSPKFEVYFNYWSQLRDLLFLRLRKENKKNKQNVDKSEKKTGNDLWYGYHNAAILSYFIETQRESLCDLQKAIHFKLFDLLFESIADTEGDSTVISEQGLTLMKSVSYLYIETDNIFHATSVLYHIMRNYCFTGDSSDKLIEKWTRKGANTEVFATNMDWKVIYLIIRLVTKYVETQSSPTSNTSQDYQKVDRGLSQFTIPELRYFRTCVMEKICKYNPNQDLYMVWKTKWSTEEESNRISDSSAFPKLETEQEIIENCFYLLYLIVSKDRERSVKVSDKKSVEKSFEENETSNPDSKSNASQQTRSSSSLLSKVATFLKKAKMSLFGNSTLLSIVMYLAGMVGTAFILRTIYNLLSPSRMYSETPSFNLSKNDLQLPYLDNPTKIPSNFSLPSRQLDKTNFANMPPIRKFEKPAATPTPIATLGTGSNEKLHPENKNIVEAGSNIKTILKPNNFKTDFYKQVESTLPGTRKEVNQVVERDYKYIEGLRDEMDHVFEIAENMKKPPTKDVEEKTPKKKQLVSFRIEEPSGESKPLDGDLLSTDKKTKQSIANQPPSNRFMDVTNEEQPYNPVGFGGSDILPPFPSSQMNSNLTTLIGSEGVFPNKTSVTSNNRINNLNRTIAPKNPPSTTRTNVTPVAGPKVFGKKKRVQ